MCVGVMGRGGGANLCSDPVEPRESHIFTQNKKPKSFVLSPQRQEKGNRF